MKKILLFMILVATLAAAPAALANTLQSGQAVQLQEDAELIRSNKVVGSLPAGAVVAFVQFEEDYTRIQLAGTTYIIASQKLEATAIAPSISNRVKAAYPLTVTAKAGATIVDENGTELQKLKKGQKLTLQGVHNQRGVVDFLSGSALIDLKQFHYVELVDGSKKLTYAEMEYKLQVIALMYPSLTKLSEIGQSVEGRTLYALTLGTGKKEILMDGSFHAREHMTTNVLMEMIEHYVRHYVNETKMQGYDVNKLLQKVSIVFVPMVNPDGVTLAQGGKVKTSRAKLVAINSGSTNFDRWKANANGGDLNRQFAVNWQSIKNTKPSFKGYKGTAPYTEPEAVAMKRLIDQGNHLAYVSYHSSGQIIYWGRAKTQFARTKKLVKGVSNITGYQMMPVTKSNAPTAASEDYFTQTKDRPAMTVEIAPFAGEASVPLKQWGNVWKRNATVGLYAAREASKW